MFFESFFVILDSQQILQAASVPHVRIPTKELGVKKYSSWRMALRQLFFRKKAEVKGPEWECLRLKIHLVDLLELNLKAYRKNKGLYLREALQELPGILQGKGSFRKIHFLLDDFMALQERKKEFFKKAQAELRQANSLEELYALKSRFIGNSYLLTYRVKQRFDF